MQDSSTSDVDLSKSGSILTKSLFRAAPANAPGRAAGARGRARGNLQPNSGAAGAQGSEGCSGWVSVGSFDAGPRRQLGGGVNSPPGSGIQAGRETWFPPQKSAVENSSVALVWAPTQMRTPLRSWLEPVVHVVLPGLMTGRRCPPQQKAVQAVGAPRLAVSAKCVRLRPKPSGRAHGYRENDDERKPPQQS